jgi:hypothetical protein
MFRWKRKKRFSYIPGCENGKFSEVELPLYGVLGSLDPGSCTAPVPYSLVRHASPLVRRNPPVQLGDAQDSIWENALVRVRCNENEGAVGDERREQASVRTLHKPFELGR